MKITDTSKNRRDEWLFGRNPGAIEGQEAAGQAELAASSQLPTRGLDKMAEEFMAAEGFVRKDGTEPITLFVSERTARFLREQGPASPGGDPLAEGHLPSIVWEIVQQWIYERRTMTEENPVTDEMLKAFEGRLGTMCYTATESGMAYSESTLEMFREAIHAAIKAGGFVSEDSMRDSVDAALRGM